jgi:hypothetical protein
VYREKHTASLDTFLLRRNTRLAFSQNTRLTSKIAYRAHLDSARCALESESSGVERHVIVSREALAPLLKKIFLSLLNELERSDTKIFSRYLAVLGHHIYHDSSRHFYTLAL